MDVFSIRVIEMPCRRETWIERVDRPNYLERLIILCHRCTDQGFFVRCTVSFCVTRTRVPGAGYDKLIIVDLAVLNADPMGKSASRSLREANAFTLRGPSRRVPLSVSESAEFAGFQIVQQLGIKLPGPSCDKTCLKPAGRCAAES